jgi:membrane protein CcdC involved in cytochrome C biogenesis
VDDGYLVYITQTSDYRVRQKEIIEKRRKAIHFSLFGINADRVLYGSEMGYYAPRR